MRSSLDELTDMNGCVSGATNASVCRSCPAGSYSNATGCALMAKQNRAMSPLWHTPHIFSFCASMRAEVACQAVQPLLGTGYSRGCKAKSYSEGNDDIERKEIQESEYGGEGGSEGRRSEEDGCGGVKRELIWTNSQQEGY